MAADRGIQVATQIAGEQVVNPFAGIGFPTAPVGLYDGQSWSLPFAGAWYKSLDCAG